MSKCRKCNECCGCAKRPKSVKFGACEQCHHCEHDKPPEKVEKHCNGCVCNQLKRLNTLTEVDVFLSGGQVLEDVVFISLNEKDCCAFFNDPTTEPGSTLIVNCQDIQAIRIEVG